MRDLRGHDIVLVQRGPGGHLAATLGVVVRDVNARPGAVTELAMMFPESGEFNSGNAGGHVW